MRFMGRPSLRKSLNWYPPGAHIIVLTGFPIGVARQHAEAIKAAMAKGR